MATIYTLVLCTSVSIIVSAYQAILVLRTHGLGNLNHDVCGCGGTAIRSRCCPSTLPPRALKLQAPLSE